MTPGARVQTAIELLDAVIAAARNNGASADVVIAQGFRERRYAGSKDKRAIRDLVYRAIRSFGDVPVSGRAAILGLNDPDVEAVFGAGGYGPDEIVSDEARATQSVAPAWMDGEFIPMINAAELATLLERAPLDLRVNALKATRDEILAVLGGEALAFTRHGIRFAEPFDVEASDAYLSGKVEVQDAGSQLISDVCHASPSMTVVDLCAGAGGKTLSLAADMAGQGHLIACDTDRARLQRLPDRATRAGAVVETRLLNPGRELEALGDLAGAADVVLVDAPCSGSGTWRRNPELRWRLTPARLERILAMQAQVLEVAQSLVRPGGVLVYAVCSVFAGEGAGQIDAFLDRHAGWSAEELALPAGRPSGKGYALTPFHDATDGFFIARLARSC